MPQRPNILFVICDDLTWGDPACHGNPYTHTPHLDTLYAQGTRLTRYCSGPVCTPARAALFTGRHPYRTKAIDTYLGRSTLDPDERTLAELLSAAGYATGLFGKWHLGDTYPSRPHDKGFQEALYHTGGGLGQPANVGRNSYFDPDLMHNGELVHTHGYCSDVFTDAALRFIEAQHGQPWFTFVGFNAPHAPFEIANEWIAPHRAQTLPDKWARLYGMVENIDSNVGRLLQRGDDNTVVIFTSDHGRCGSTTVDGKNRFNGGLRGGKCELYEGGVRVPCFWRWPGQFPAAHDVDRLANPIDILPTLAAVAGAPLPTDRVIDGRNLLPLLTGAQRGTDWPDRSICLQWHRGDVPQRWHNAATLQQRWKWYSPGGAGRDELYDIEADPQEQHDVAAQHPAIVQSLRAEYSRWFDDVSNTRPDNYAWLPIHLGSGHENPVTLTRHDWRVYDGKDGWDDDTPGFWPVRIHAAGDYSIIIDLPAFTGAKTLHLRGGAVALAVSIAADISAYTPLTTYGFDRVRLEAGDHRLEAYLEGDGQRLGVRYVHVALLS